jgi:hypothetical protein
MNASASPKPASGPVFGLTCPILMTRLWAFAGIARSTAGAAIAASPTRAPAPISFRREMPERCNADDISFFGMWNLPCVMAGRVPVIRRSRL